MTGLPNFNPRTYIEELGSQQGIYKRLEREKALYSQPVIGQPLAWNKSKSVLELPQFLSQAKAHVKQYPYHYGAGAGFLGLWATQPGQFFSGKDDNYNTIEGLSHKGIAQRQRKELTDFSSPVNLAKAVMRAERLYKGLAKGHLRQLGVKTDELMWASHIQEVAGGAKQLTVMASHKTVTGPEQLFEVTRTFGKSEVGLINIEMAEEIRGRGLGSSIYKAEPELFKLLGYTEGEKIYSPLVTSPTTQKWIAAQYGARQTAGVEGAMSMEGKLSLTKRLEFTHKVAQVNHTRYANKPGKRHMYKTGRIVGP